MFKKYKKVWLLAIPLILILGYALWDTFNQPSIEDLPGDFKEVAFVRNEQNKGGVIRVYAVSVGHPTQADYNACADLFPVNEINSTTKIYFFDKHYPYPTTLTIEPPHYDVTKYQAINIIKRTGKK